MMVSTSTSRLVVALIWSFLHYSIYTVLYWFLIFQELKAKRSSRRSNNSSNDPRDDITRSSGTGTALSKSKYADHSSGGKNTEGHGSSNSRRKQNKGFAKPHPIHKQRLFSGNYRNHGVSRNTVGTISESPPSDSVGFFFGSTPPDSHVYVLDPWSCSKGVVYCVFFLRLFNYFVKSRMKIYQIYDC